MSDQQRIERESLSALMDNEADDLELRRVLKACDQNPDLLATWERYHLVQAVLHGDARAVSPDLSARIAAQIAAESSPLAAPAPSRFGAWQQSLGKLAIAASVALLFGVAVQTDFSPNSGPAVVQQSQPEAATPLAPAPVATLLATDTAPAELDPVSTQFLRDYLERVTINEEEPVITVHIQDSPLFRLVNNLDSKR